MSNLETQKALVELETQKFELEQRRARALSVSAFFPKDLRNDVASAVIVYDLAQRMNVSVMEVSQSVYIIHGRPSFSTSFLVARLNQSGLIKGALKTVVADDGQSAYCEAVDAATGETLKGMTITMEIARAEGWLTKNGSKWKTMPELMLRKRAQAFFIREYYPQVMFGVQSVEEVEDTEAIDTTAVPSTDGKVDINAAITQGARKPKDKEATVKQPVETEAIEAEVEEVAPVQEQTQESDKPKRKRRTKEEVEEILREANTYRPKGTPEYTKLSEIPKEEGKAAVERIENRKKAKEVQEAAKNGQTNQEAPAQEAEYTEAVVEDDNPFIEETQEPPTQEQKVGAGNKVAVHYGLFMTLGLKRSDLTAFVEWCGLTADNIDEFVADRAGIEAMIEQFNEEAGYA